MSVLADDGRSIDSQRGPFGRSYIQERASESGDVQKTSETEEREKETANEIAKGRKEA